MMQGPSYQNPSIALGLHILLSSQVVFIKDTSQ